MFLFAVAVLGGCDREVTIIDDTPAQFIEATNDGRNWEVYFDKQPKNVSVEGAEEYGLLGEKLWITGEGSTKGEIIVSWQGGKKTFTYRPSPRKVEEPPPAPPPARTVTVEPPPGARIPPNQQFTLTFDQNVANATVNGSPATGSGLNWIASPDLEEGRGMSIIVHWNNLGGSNGSHAFGPYTVVPDD